MKQVNCRECHKVVEIQTGDSKRFRDVKDSICPSCLHEKNLKRLTG